MNYITIIIVVVAIYIVCGRYVEVSGPLYPE